MQASGDLLTDPDPVISQKIVQIETNSAGSGSLVSDKTLYPGDQITIYAILRDNASNYLGNVAVDWTSFGSLGTLNIQLDGKSAIFTASNVGSGYIQAKYNELTSKMNLQVVANPNQAPSASDDQFSIVKNSSGEVISVMANDTDPDGDTLQMQSFTQGSNGTVTDNMDGTLTYQPNSGYTGSDSFQYTIQDPDGETSTATVSIKVLTPFTWTGAGANALWSTSGNWCGAITNGVCDGGAAPGASDIAILDGTCATNCSPQIDSAISVSGVLIGNGYSGTVQQIIGGTQSEVITIGSDGWIQSSGNFLGGDALIDINGPLQVSGTSSFQSTTGQLSLGYDSNVDATLLLVENTSNFAHNNGEVAFVGTRPWQCGTTNYLLDVPTTFELYNLILQGKYTGCGGGNSNHYVKSGSVIKVLGQAQYYRGSYGGNWEFYGDFLVQGPETGNQTSGGTGTFIISGNSNQSVIGNSDASLPMFVINSTGGTVTMTGTLQFGHGFTYTSGTVDASSANFLAKASSSQSWTVGPLVVNSVSQIGNGSLIPLDPITTNDLSISKGTISGGQINTLGNVTASLGTLSGVQLNFNGSSNQALTQASGTFSSCEINVNSSSTVTLGSAISLGGSNLTLNSGSIVSNGFDFTGIGTLGMQGGTFTKTTENVSYSSCTGSPCPP
ncbi:MAG: cadherin-like domain-containing protein [Bdellovibrionales bacterium]|nr:cadherin-like domain-containing protein [Bdellovibrionales bacterium]